MRPTWAPPAGAVDAHCHVLGPGDVFPYATDRTFTPVDAPKDEVAARQKFLGFDRAVIVQSSCYGTDHTVLLDALAADPDNLRGVAIVTPETLGDIADLNAAGVRGARLHFMRHLGEALSLTDQRTVIEAVNAQGWHIELHLQGDGAARHEDMIADLDGPVVIDHLGRVDLLEGLDGKSVRSLRNLLDLGHVWIKLSGIDRVSLTGPPYLDAIELARLLADHAPERVLWGTDYPHPNILGDAPDDGLLVEQIMRFCPTDDARRLLLVDNPNQVFDFAPLPTN